MSINRTPKTVEELGEAINQLFTPINAGEPFQTAIVYSGDQSVRFVTYVSAFEMEASRKPEGAISSSSAWWPTTEQAVEALWEVVLSIKYDPIKLATKEIMEDAGGAPFLHPTTVWWRSYPQLETLDTGICRVRMRAAFL